MTKPVQIVQFRNCKLVKNGKLVDEDLWIQNGKIIDPEPIFYTLRKQADTIIDCKQMIIAPGYIELQINGGYGYDFSSTDTEESIQVVATNLVKRGVTSFCPTLVTLPAESYRKIMPKIKRGPIKGGATILGVHVEGPFICKKKKGAHPEEYIQNDTIESVQQIENVYSDMSNVSIITLAPELDKHDVIRSLQQKGLTVSLGHSSANLEDSERAFKNGAQLITHLFNAMPLFHHRDPGLLGLLTIDSDQQIYYGIIADGIHTHYTALRLAFQANKAGMVLVSDAISAAGLDHGIHMVGAQQIEIKGNKAFVAGTDTLCGSITLMDQCVRFMKTTVNCSIVDAIDCATLHPAKALRIDNQKGTLRFGSDADFIILDANLNVLATFVAGECVHVSADCQIQLNN